MDTLSKPENHHKTFNFRFQIARNSMSAFRWHYLLDEWKGYSWKKIGKILKQNDTSAKSNFSELVRI